jgi:hypothetical protein
MMPIYGYFACSAVIALVTQSLALAFKLPLSNDWSIIRDLSNRSCAPNRCMLHSLSATTARNQRQWAGKLYSQTTSRSQVRSSNIYQEYCSTGKPVVLIGHASNEIHDEVQRLALSAATALGPNHSVRSLNSWAVGASASDDDGKSRQWVGKLFAEFPSSTGTNDNPEVWFLDTSASFWSSRTAALEQILHSLYVDQANLVVYVNVRSNHPQLIDLRRFSDYEICIQDEGQLPRDHSCWLHLEWELMRLLARAWLPPAVPGATEPTVNTAALTMGPNTFFLSLTFPNVRDVESIMPSLCSDVDALEYRTDLLASVNSWIDSSNFRSRNSNEDVYFDIIYGMQLLRQYARPHVVRVPALPFRASVIEDVMPLVYTVRTSNQAGKVRTLSIVSILDVDWRALLPFSPWQMRIFPLVS